MSKYHIFVITFYPIVLISVTGVWISEFPEYTWKEMYLNMWRAE